jgi:hypothetical protein
MQLSNRSPGGHGSITTCRATGRCKTSGYFVSHTPPGYELRFERRSPLSFAPYRAAGASAGMRRARPAAAAQGGRDHGRAFAGTFSDVDRAEPEGLRIVDGEVEVVAALVPTYLFVLVVSQPVEFDAKAVFGVPVVLVVGPPADGTARLALSPGKSVRALDVARSAIPLCASKRRNQLRCVFASILQACISVAPLRIPSSEAVDNSRIPEDGGSVGTPEGPYRSTILLDGRGVDGTERAATSGRGGGLR